MQSNGYPPESDSFLLYFKLSTDFWESLIYTIIIIFIKLLMRLFCTMA